MSPITRRGALAAAALLLPTSAAAQRRKAPPAAGWRARAPMPWPAQEIYAAVVGGRVYVAGGLVGRAEGGIDILDRTAVYDAARNRWREGPRLPAPTHHPAMAAAGGRVFALGGFREAAAGQWSAVTDVLALDGGRWTKVGDMPGPQSETVALEHAGRIHLITGRAPGGAANAQWVDQSDLAVHRVFEPKSGRWSEAAPVRGARNSAAGAVIGGKLYVVGGRTVGGGNMARLDRYDPETDAWESLRDMPQASGGLAAAAAGGKLYVFGGEWFGPNRAGGVYVETWEYDPAVDAWRAIAPMRTPRHGLAGVSVGGRVLAIGGATRFSARDTSAVVEALTP